MTYFNRGGNGGGGFRDNRGGGGRPSFNDRGSERPQLFSAVCDQCGKNCEVPFRPNGSKPIYCSECFEAKGGSDRGNDRGGDRGGFRNDRGNDRPSFSGFGGNDRGADRTSVRRFESTGKPIDNTSEKLDKISDKLDKLITLLTPKVEVVSEVVDPAKGGLITKKVKKVKKAVVSEITE